MAYTPPSYNVVSADLRPSGSPAATIPAYNVVNANLSIEDGGGGGTSQTIIPSSINSIEFGTPTFMLFHSFVFPTGIESEEYVGYPTFELGTFYIEPYSIPSEEYVGYPAFQLKKFYIEPYSIPSDEHVGYPEFTLKISHLLPTSIESAEDFGYPEFQNSTQVISFAGVDTAESFGYPEFFTLHRVLQLDSIESAEDFGYPEFFTLHRVLQLDSIESAEDFGYPEFRLANTWFEFDFEDGGEFSVDLSIDPALVVEIYSGAAVEVDLYTDTPIDQLIEIGEEFSVELESYPIALFEGEFESGEEFSADLHTDELFEAIVGAGEFLDIDFEVHPQHFIDAEIGDGADLDVELTTKPLYENLGETTAGAGESLEADLDVPEGNALSVYFYEGVDLVFDTISTASALGVIEFLDGVELLVEDLDELSNYKFADGSSLELGLSTSSDVGGIFQDGAELSGELDTRPPESISVDFEVGECLEELPLRILSAIPLRVTFCDGVYITATESTSTTYYDLEGPPSYPNRLGWWLDMNQFEFIDMPPSFSWGSGAGIVVTASLQTRPRFSISVSTGESFSTVRGYDYVEVEASYGLSSPPREFFYIEPRINLCYPNVFPSPDNAEIELDFDDGDCYADFVYAGEAMSSSLSCVYTVAPVWFREGAVLDFDLTIYDLWRLEFYTGQELEVYLGTIPALPLYFEDGQSMSVQLEEPEALFGTGESMELELTITFEVEFLERGCLDNEHRYLTPNGDEDVAKFNPVAVELEPYSHEIKARCF